MYIYDSETQQKKYFNSKDYQNTKFKIYVCGITAYDYCHIGHARIMVVYDTLVRLLRHLKFNVKYVRNITDIDDKIINKAINEQVNIHKITAKFTAAMHADEKALNVLPPDIEPKATEHIKEMDTMLKQLITKNYAYIADNGDIYFRVSKFKKYGKLSNRNLSDLHSGARVELNQNKENTLDFTMWKISKKNEPSWKITSSKLAGRPGWHLECSAMALKYLGNEIDIHGGGLDLKFPHHENEIAQSEACTDKTFVKNWMHVGFVTIKQEKMSKSLNNFFTIKTVLQEYHPEVVRLFLLTTHYRSPIDYTRQNLNKAKKDLQRIYKFIESLNNRTIDRKIEQLTSDFYTAIKDDLNIPMAMANMNQIMVAAKSSNTSKKNTNQNNIKTIIKTMLSILGIGFASFEEINEYKKAKRTLDVTEEEISAKIVARDQARKDKNFILADKIREELKQSGVELIDASKGTKW